MANLKRNRNPSLSEVMDAAVDQNIADTYTMLPGKIETYDAATQKANVKPLLKRPLRDEDGNDLPFESLPVVPGVPMVFPRASFGTNKFFQSWPMAQGDQVTLIVANWSLDQWKSKTAGEDVEPAMMRQHDLSDAVAFPGLYPFSDALNEADPDNLVLGRDDGGIQLHFLTDDTVELRVGGVADEVAVKGNAHKVTYDAHFHSSPWGPTGVPTVAMPAGDLSTVVKFKA